MSYREDGSCVWVPLNLIYPINPRGCWKLWFPLTLVEAVSMAAPLTTWAQMPSGQSTARPSAQLGRFFLLQNFSSSHTLLPQLSDIFKKVAFVIWVLYLLQWELAASYTDSSAAAAKSFQLCPTLCDPINGSPPGSPVPGILQARTLEWVAISFSNTWKWKMKVKSLSHVRLLAIPWTAAYQAPLSVGFSRQEYWSGVPWSLTIF